MTNWKEVEGNDEEIRPYVRNRNSGSQEKFETLVMAGLTIAEFPELQVGLTMMSPYFQLEDDEQGIGFSPFYYYSVIVGQWKHKSHRHQWYGNDKGECAEQYLPVYHRGLCGSPLRHRPQQHSLRIV